MGLGVAILTISDSVSNRTSVDESGPFLQSLFADPEGSSLPWPAGLEFETFTYNAVPDDRERIAHAVLEWISSEVLDIHLIVTTGGTGFGRRDVTPEVKRERKIPSPHRLIHQSSLAC